MKKYRFSEVVDSVKSLEELIKVNHITQKEIVNIILVWDEEMGEVEND